MLLPVNGGCIPVRKLSPSSQSIQGGRCQPCQIKQAIYKMFSNRNVYQDKYIQELSPPFFDLCQRVQRQISKAVPLENLPTCGSRSSYLPSKTQKKMHPVHSHDISMDSNNTNFSLYQKCAIEGFTLY